MYGANYSAAIIFILFLINFKNIIFRTIEFMKLCACLQAALISITDATNLQILDAYHLHA